jgi:hypothetical protein
MITQQPTVAVSVDIGLYAYVNQMGVRLAVGYSHIQAISETVAGVHSLCMTQV